MTHPDLQVVDEQDRPIHGAPFDEVYKKGLYHRVSRVVVQDAKGAMLLQKRSTNVKLFPGCWDMAASGHVNVGETYRAAAARELHEELGLTGELTELGSLKTHGQLPGKIINRFARVYKIVIDRKATITFPADEVSEVKWFTLAEVKQLAAEQPGQVSDGLIDTLTHLYAS